MPRLCYRSRNRNRRFQAAAKTIAAKIAGIDGVVGIVAVGGIGRGHSDEFSDLDLIVYADHASRRKIGAYIAVGQLYHKGVQYDIPVVSYRMAMRRAVPSAYWSQELRWTLTDARIFHDTGNRIADMLSEKVIFPGSERNKLLRDNRHWADEILNYMFPTWKARGQAYNLAHLLRTAAEHIILWIYAHNGLFRPYMRKWPFYYLENGLVPESKYFAVIKRAYTASLSSLSEAETLRDDLFALCDRIDIGIKPIAWEKVLKINADNWIKASEKTRYYLSW